MNFKSDFSPHLKKYERFLNHFERRVDINSSTFRLKHNSALKTLKGMEPLLSSLSSISMADRNSDYIIKEWNPFSQRVYFPKMLDMGVTTFVSQFDKIIDSITCFIETIHEANHILLLEPFFVGRFHENFTKDDFLKFFLHSEGYCFWYSDIIVTKKLREKFKNGEFVLSRTAVSQRHFHPYRAFEALGIKDVSKILDIYLKSFVLQKTRLSKSKKNLFARDLFNRFSTFHLQNSNSIRTLEMQLKEMNILGEFQSRFCKINNLPSLLPEKILKIRSTKSYFHAVFSDGLKYMESLSQKNLERIRYRRFIQTRAYSAFSLIHAIKTNNFVSTRSIRSLDIKKLLFDLNIYLKNLEFALHDLAGGSPVKSIREYCRTNDVNYSKNIFKTINNNDLWLKKRRMIFPYQKFPVKIIDNIDDVSIREIDHINLWLFKICLVYSLNELTSKSPLMKNFLLFLQLISIPNYYKSKKYMKIWKENVNRILLDPKILKKWSVSLSSINPEKNSFRELLFQYE